MLFRSLASLFVSILLLLCPVRANAQSYTSTSSNLSYNPTTQNLRFESEWTYTIGQNQYWYFNALTFDVQVSAFTSQANYNNGIAHSTNLYTYTALPGQWSQGVTSPGNGRVYGYRDVPLPSGYLYVVSLVAPKVSGTSTTYPSGPISFNWAGNAGGSGLVIDRLWPGDG